MPKYTVETQYMLPVYRHTTVTARTPEAACKAAVEDDDWDSAEKSYDGSGPIHVSGLWQGADAAYQGPEVPIPPGMGEEPSATLRELLDAASWVVRLYGTDHPQGLAELREEVRKLREALPKVRAELPGYVSPRIGEPACP